MSGPVKPFETQASVETSMCTRAAKQCVGQERGLTGKVCRVGVGWIGQAQDKQDCQHQHTPSPTPSSDLLTRLQVI